MVKLEELEDEHFLEKPAATRDDTLLADDEDDYTDTDSEISDASDVGEPDESIFDRITALKDMVPPKARARISAVTNTVTSTASSTIHYGGKGLWILTSSILLLAVPYALALSEEQQIQDEERQRLLMQEGASGMMNVGNVDDGAKPAL